MAVDTIRRVKNPFKMLTVKDIMRDLNICETVAYKTFKRDDFPSINVGKTNQVMLVAYLIWKMQKEFRGGYMQNSKKKKLAVSIMTKTVKTGVAPITYMKMIHKKKQEKQNLFQQNKKQRIF